LAIPFDKGTNKITQNTVNETEQEKVRKLERNNENLIIMEDKEKDLSGDLRKLVQEDLKFKEIDCDIKDSDKQSDQDKASMI
jgi:hypothetical protein